jgi:hypothetical protein
MQIYHWLVSRDERPSLLFAMRTSFLRFSVQERLRAILTAVAA